MVVVAVLELSSPSFTTTSIVLSDLSIVLASLELLNLIVLMASWYSANVLEPVRVTVI